MVRKQRTPYSVDNQTHEGADNASREPNDPLPFERPWDKRTMAAILGTTESGLDKLIKLGRAPPFFKAGRMPRWRPSVAKRWIAEQEERAAIEAVKAREKHTVEAEQSRAARKADIASETPPSA